VNFDPKELRSAIIAASNSQNGSIVRELVLLCSHYNPITGKYGGAILNVVRALSVVTVLLLAGWIFSMCRREPSTGAG
jgi:protein SCO1/2